MTIFRVGQRVRIVEATTYRQFVGREATIVGPLETVRDPKGRSFTGHHLDIDGQGKYSAIGLRLFASPNQLRPLTDPKADAFIESIKKMVPNNVVTKESA